ncbi:hypothetical protein GOP47_0005663 [Adiantum capillus-veneris]|uniref:Uncharacterized protein n=1 Tax=Adiantum capillus-veneris TaxID=13818 RepID=A0A9D4ZLT0_ADICA|nr:hypothetical protein GOP47_0005663 [Adiantum capillus-veneris]
MPKNTEGSTERQKLEERKEKGSLKCACKGGFRTAIIGGVCSSFDAKGHEGGGKEVEEAIARVVGVNVPAAEEELGGANPEEHESKDRSGRVKARGKGHAGEDGQAGQQA